MFMIWMSTRLFLKTNKREDVYEKENLDGSRYHCSCDLCVLFYIISNSVIRLAEGYER